MIVKINVVDAIKLGFNEVDYGLYLCGPVIGEYAGNSQVAIDMSQDMSYDLRAKIERKAILPKGKISDKFHKWFSKLKW